MQTGAQGGLLCQDMNFEICYVGQVTLAVEICMEIEKYKIPVAPTSLRGKLTGFSEEHSCDVMTLRVRTKIDSVLKGVNQSTMV